jgi:hypothetical protein
MIAPHAYATIHIPYAKRKKLMTTLSVTIGSLLRRYRYLLIALVLLILGTLAVVASPPPRDLTWNPSSLAPTVIAGGASVTTTVSFTDTGKLPLPDAEVQLSPNLAGLVTVSPTHLGTVKQGQTVALTLTASAPASSTPAVISGSIQIQKKNPHPEMYGSPVQVNLSVTWPAVSNQGATFAYPPTWILDQQSVSLGGPISVRNFAQYEHGGVRPNGGAEIDVFRIPLPQEPITTAIANDLSGAVTDTITAQQVAGVPATRVAYHDAYTPVSQERGVTVYVPFGSVLYKFSLQYALGDPNEAGILTAFNELLSTASLSNT